MPYGSGRARKAGWKATYYPIELVRAMVAVWLFGGCRVDEIRRLELDCITWDEGTDDTSGEPFTICLLHIPQNKTSRPFNKPVDPVVGQLIDAWKLVRPPQPDLADRKTGQKRQHLFCHRGQLGGKDYLNHNILPALCRKSGVPQADSRGALTSHRARATIATQLLNAREPLTLNDLQQWLDHKHPASTRYYAAILQRTLTAAYKKADYFCPQRPHHPGPRRPRVHPHRRRRRGRTALEVLRPRRRVLQLRLLRQVSPPHGLRSLPVLRPEGVHQGPASRGQGGHQHDA
jgi:hypothetical protein